MSFWQNKKVLITGSNGFVGSHLTKDLANRGAKIITLNKSNSNKEHRDIISIIGTVEDYKFVDSIVREHEVQVIFHLAAQPIVEVGEESPLPTFESNIRGSWNILETARVHNVEKLIIASSTHVYGDNPNLPYKEEYYPQPSRPYETSKACVDLLAQSYADTYNLPVEIPRFVNIYGPGDKNMSRLIPKVIYSILNSENPHVWDVGAVRDFLFVEDAISAYRILAEKEFFEKKRIRVINFGSGKQTDILTVVNKLIEISGNIHIKPVTEKVPKEREKEIKKQYISIDKAKTILGWEPRYSLDEGLKLTFSWYKNHFFKE